MADFWVLNCRCLVQGGYWAVHVVQMWCSIKWGTPQSSLCAVQPLGCLA